MKTAILHISDLHISSENDYIVSNCSVITSAIRYYTNECDRCIVIITGDIIDKGRIISYPVAKQFLLNLKSQLILERNIFVDFVIVPGNHDLDFSLPQKMRGLAIEDLNKQDTLSDDNEELICAAIAPQKEFWIFANELMDGINLQNHVSYSKSYSLGNCGNIIFHCYNSSFLSTIDEQPGSLVIHENFFIHESNKSANDIIISIFHHSPSWLSTRTPRNNQKQFQRHILKESNIIMCGHEHMSHSLAVAPSLRAANVLLLEADSFKYGTDKKFDLLIINSENTGSTIEKSHFK